MNLQKFIQNLFIKKEEILHSPYNQLDYKDSLSREKAQAHRDFLKAVDSEENDRLASIENKTSQLISQTGIIFSLLSLFIPILIDKLPDENAFVKALLLLLFFLAFYFYMRTIQKALKNFYLKNFKYSRPSSKNVLDFQEQDLRHFYSEEVRDLLYSINNNVVINNTKGTNLLHSFIAFRTANIFTGLLVTTFCLVFFFRTAPKHSNTVDFETTLKHLDSLMLKTIYKPQKVDTVYIDSSRSKITDKGITDKQGF